jgi:1-aminocyclopropane-1-carboxylate deaminase/D-cysteine desulfhydrase-like pyridoxal-dependent ACC family enzyme
LSYGGRPTPLEPLTRLTEKIGGPSLWIKRDDYFGPGLGGNKGRSLDFLMAEILQSGKKKVITFGGLQSNHARMTAAACAALGLEAHLFFLEKRPPTLTGNLLLDELFGAKLHFIPIGAGGDASMSLELAIRLVRYGSFCFVGPGAYFMPVGGHTVTGCLGYVDAALEIHRQVHALGLAERPTTIIVPTGTGGTIAGLLVGFTLLNSPIKLLGLDIGKLWKGFPTTLAKMATSLSSALGQPTHFQPDHIPLIEETYAGPGYGIITAETDSAIRLLAQQEGIILDPVYTGKGFAGLLDLISKKYFQPDEQIIFLHTGGGPGLFRE